MRVAMISELGPWSASTRYRALQFAPLLADRLGTFDVFAADDQPRRRPGKVGQASYFASHALRYAKRWHEVTSILKHYDAVFVQRGIYALGPGAIAKPLHRFDGKVVFDLDDAVFALRPSLTDKSAATKWLYGPQQARQILTRADAAIVSTTNLASSLPATSAEVLVLPTIPDPAQFEISDQKRPLRTVGWAGTNGGLVYLDALHQTFEELAKRNIGEFEVVSSAPWNGPSRFTRWNIDNEATMFSDWAVGIMPLPDTAYTRSKAGFKLLQYMSAGVPVVASPVGVNRELVESSGAGYLASTPEEWSTALTNLLNDSDLRVQMGTNGLNFVREFADVEHHADTIARVLRS